MELNPLIDMFNFDQVRSYQNIELVGKLEDKLHIITDLINNFKGQKSIVIISDNCDSNTIIVEHYKKQNIKILSESELLNNFRMEELEEKYGCVVFEDLFKYNDFYKKMLESKLMIVLSSENPIYMSVEISNLIDFVFCSRVSDFNLYKLYMYNFSKYFKRYNDFKETFNSCMNNNFCLILDKKSSHQNLFYYVSNDDILSQKTINKTSWSYCSIQ